METGEDSSEIEEVSTNKFAMRFAEGVSLIKTLY